MSLKFAWEIIFQLLDLPKTKTWELKDNSSTLLGKYDWYIAGFS